jgi:hypothetical protein
MTIIRSHRQSWIVAALPLYDHARHHTGSQPATLGCQVHALYQRPLCLNTVHAADQHIASGDTTPVDKIRLDAASHHDVSGALFLYFAPQSTWAELST